MVLFTAIMIDDKPLKGIINFTSTERTACLMKDFQILNYWLKSRL